jgi:hypothetical protein
MLLEEVLMMLSVFRASQGAASLGAASREHHKELHLEEAIARNGGQQRDQVP